MLEVEIEWAQEQLDSRHASHEKVMRGLQTSLETLHMNLQEASGKRFYIPLEQKKRELERDYPAGAMERSPIRQKYTWSSAMVDDANGSTTAAAQLFSRKLSGHNHVIFDNDTQLSVLSSSSPLRHGGAYRTHAAAVPDAISQTTVGKLLKGWTQAATFEHKGVPPSGTYARGGGVANSGDALYEPSDKMKSSGTLRPFQGAGERDRVTESSQYGVRPSARRVAPPIATATSLVAAPAIQLSIARALQF